MTNFQYDLLVIGAGPAGESAAISAKKNNLSVAVVDGQPSLGGNCAHKGTIPSKALRNAVKQAIRMSNQPFAKRMMMHQELNYPQILAAVNDIIPKQVELHSEYFIRNKIPIFNGFAHFVNKNEVEIAGPHGLKDRITAENILIATGSRPYRPKNIDFNHARVFDSDTILQMDTTPSTIVIFGAGVIGCEYASIFAGLGLKVDLINSRDRLLSFLDDEISDALSYHLRSGGVMVRHSEIFDSAEYSDKGVTVHLRSGKHISADALLWSNGRSGNTDALNLEAVGLAADSRGQLKVDQCYRTETPNIYAAGDVIGWPSLASASFDQGRSVVDAILGRDVRFIADAPTGIYTIPEISSVGKTESELTEAKVPYEVGRAFFRDTARGQISGEDEGMLKLLFHNQTREILGIHCFGAEASEIIHIGQAIMQQPEGANTIEYFVNSTFNYPTMAEAYRIAALNGINRLMRMR